MGVLDRDQKHCETTFQEEFDRMEMALRHRLVVIIIILLAAIGVACGGSEPASTQEPNISPTFSPTIAPTSAAQPTSSPTRTGAPSPTPIPVPTPTVTPVPKVAPTATHKDEPQPPPLGQPCSDFGDVTFTVPPMDLDTIFYIRPMGAISGGHTIPTGHLYIHPRNPGERPPPYGPETYPPPYEVRAPAAGHIVGIDTMSGHLRPAPDGQPGLVEDYFVEIYTPAPSLPSTYI